MDITTDWKHQNQTFRGKLNRYVFTNGDQVLENEYTLSDLWIDNLQRMIRMTLIIATWYQKHLSIYFGFGSQLLSSVISLDQHARGNITRN